MKKALLFLVASVFLFSAISMANADEKLMVYTSMKESLIGSLRDAFVKKHPDIAFDYYSAGAGKLMAKNGAIMGQGSGQVVDDTASGDLLATLAVDYITIDKIKKGAYLGFVFPKEMLVVPSPIAIMKGTENRKAAEKFIDFLLSKEGQTLIAASGTLPIRTDVVVSTDMGLVPADQAVERAMKLDYIKTMNEKEEIIKKFTSIIREKN